MSERKEHAYIRVLRRQLAEGKIDRREFLRTVTLLGLSASAAYAFAGKAKAETKPAMPKGGILRISMPVRKIEDPHTFSSLSDSNVVRQVTEYLTKTGHDNITRPYLLQSWKPSEDLKTWTLHLRRGIKWHNGRDFTADDVIWNLKHVLDDKTGSSVLGLMKGYMLEEDGEGKTRLWDANAIEKVDSFTIRLNCKVPQLAVPEHLFHYPLLILDPEEGGVFGPGSSGTGAFELVEHEVGKLSVLKARKDYWGDGPHLDTLEFIDLGGDPQTEVSAFRTKKVDGADSIDVVEFEALKLMPHLKRYDAVTAGTGLARGKVTEKPFDDARVRKALRLAIDPRLTQELVRGVLGSPAEHHHVSPIHPEYAKLPPMWVDKKRNVEAAKRLLAEAGYSRGIDLGRIDCRASPDWEASAAQAIVEQWRDIGVRCGVNTMPDAKYWEIWDKTRLGFTAWSHRPLGIMVLGLAYRSGVPWNESSYSNPEFDRLLTEAEGEPDVDKRREVMAKLEKIMQEDGPIVQPFWRTVVTFMDKRVKGFEMHPTFYIFGNELAIES
ncbi:MAG: ABC transporter substrate-binding protein [Acidiferrobacterales bacterium]